VEDLSNTGYFSSAAFTPAQQSPPSPGNEQLPEVFPGSRSYHGSSSVPKPHFRIKNEQEDSENKTEDGFSGSDTPN
jgi:hypothetical protein